MPGWERNDLVANLIDLLGQCDRPIRERMVEHFARCEPDFGRRVAQGIGLPAPFVATPVAVEV